MSSFLVEDLTINKIVCKLAYGRNLEWIRGRIKERLGFDLTKTDDCEKLGALMWRMNLKATGQRYQGNIEDFRDLNYSFKLEVNNTMISVIKALQSWLYQCAEGDVPDSLEYKFFDKLSGQLALTTLADTPEWKSAKWA